MALVTTDNSNSFHLEPMSWKSYNQIKKKAMEQEFSWSGLAISLSIAFFIVVATAQGLRLIYDSLKNTETSFSIFSQSLKR